MPSPSTPSGSWCRNDRDRSPGLRSFHKSHNFPSRTWSSTWCCTPFVGFNLYNPLKVVTLFRGDLSQRKSVGKKRAFLHHAQDAHQTLKNKPNSPELGMSEPGPRLCARVLAPWEESGGPKAPTLLGGLGLGLEDPD